MSEQAYPLHHLLQRQSEGLHRHEHTPRVGLGPAELMKRSPSTFLLQLFEAVKHIPGVPHYLAGFGDVAQLLSYPIRDRLNCLIRKRNSPSYGTF